MHADTDAVRAYGGITTDLGADLQEAAAVLSCGLGAMVENAFGTVGSRFGRVLDEAAAGLAAHVRRIGENVTASGAATLSAARDYVDVEVASQTQIAQVGM
jgi:hypothetical protein